MFGKLLAFEIKLHTSQIGFWVVVSIMFILGALFMSLDFFSLSSTGEKIKANGALTISVMVAFFSMLSIFFGAVFVVGGVMRDQVHNFLEITHSTPIKTGTMMITRMIGVYIAVFLCLFAFVVGLAFGQYIPWLATESLGAKNLLYFLQPTLVFVAINALLVSGIYTAVAAITRNKALVYVTAIALFLFYMVSGVMTPQSSPKWVIALVDPFGANALALATEFWPAAEQNTRMSPLGGYVGLNRLVWGGIAIFLYLATFKLFKRGLVAGKVKNVQDAEIFSTQAISLLPAKTDYSAASAVKAFWARFKLEYLRTVKSIPFMILAALCVAFFALITLIQLNLAPDPILPTNTLLVGMVFGSLSLPLLLIIIFFSGEIIWRDKVAGMTEIIDASPVKNWSLMAGKWAALMAIVFTIFAVGLAFGMTAQIFLGDVPVNPFIHFKFMVFRFVPTFALYCILVLFVQNFMPNRIVGMVASAAVLIFFVIGINFLPFVHPLMEYGSVPAGGLSELNGFASLIRFKWFGLYWGSLAALFTVLSIWLWRRGLQATLRARIKGLSKRLSIPSIALASLFLASFAGSGAYIYKSYNVDNEFRTTKQNELRRVKWEELLGDQLKAPIPKIRSVDVEMQFSPSKQSSVIKGTYVLENANSEPLSEVYVSVPVSHKREILHLTIDGATLVTEGENIKDIEDFGHQIFKFDPPFAPGAKTELAFELVQSPPVLGDGSRILRNGTFVDNFASMPHLDIRDRRLTNPDKRRKYGLAERERAPDRTDMAARQVLFLGRSADRVDFKAKVCTDLGQIPIAPGKMIRKYEENGKACRDYQAINPILNFFSFLSADFEVIRDTWKDSKGLNGKDVDLAIYFHGQHNYNTDLMMQAMKDSLDTFTEIFGPYQYNQIRIMEFPYRGFAQAFAGTIPFSENIGFVRDPGDPDDNKSVDLATYVTMHEIGHQWFAHQIVPAYTKGFNVLSEGLTENAAMTAYERKLGWQKARRLLEQRAVQAYLTGRIVDRDDEPPLAKAEQQGYLDYNKASWVFWGIKQNMGEEKMQNAIRGFLEEYGNKGAPYPTTIQLVDALRAAAPADMQGLITDYWDRIVFWKMSIDGDVKLAGNDEDGYAVSFTAKVDKLIASEEDGKETSVSEIDGEDLNEWVEIGFYDQDPKDTLGGEWLKLERVRVTKAETQFSFKLAQKPTHVLLDPRRLLIERNVTDNVKKIVSE